jgi:hypothetical protein
VIRNDPREPYVMSSWVLIVIICALVAIALYRPLIWKAAHASDHPTSALAMMVDQRQPGAGVH